MVNKKCNGLRLITHILGETLVVFGSVLIAVNFTSEGFSVNPIFLIGLFSILTGAFCQWNPV